MEKLRNVARFGKYGKRLCMMFLFLCITTSGLMRASVFAQNGYSQIQKCNTE